MFKAFLAAVAVVLLAASGRRMQFGRSSERVTRQIEQLELRLEELEAGEAEAISQAAPSRPASKATAIRVIVRPALTTSSRQRCAKQAAVLGSAPASCAADAQCREGYRKPASSTGSSRRRQ